MTTYVDIHILQSVPPSNLNRDDTGSPKSATYGGVQRARVSSQAWKRATRTAFADYLDESELGYRTKRLVELLRGLIVDRDPDLADNAVERATKVLEAAGLKVKAPRAKKAAVADAESEVAQSEYLVFISRQQLDRLAQLAVESEVGAVDKRAAKAALGSDHSIDIALFGRMVADDANLNVDAAVQVAHAISTHAVQNEFDYFTAVDDKNPREETGAGMIGTVEFNSSTLYRFAALNIDGLKKNLGDTEATVRAASAFIQAFAKSMPEGKRNTFGNQTLPDVVLVMVREDRSVNMVGAFEEAVSKSGSGWIAPSAGKLAKHIQGVQEAFNLSSESFVAGIPQHVEPLAAVGTVTDFKDLVAQISARIEAAAENA